MSSSVSVLSDAFFTLHVKDTPRGTGGATRSISCHGKNSEVTRVQRAVEEALWATSFAGTEATVVRVSRSRSINVRGWQWTITFVGMPRAERDSDPAFPGLEIDKSEGAGVTISAGPISLGSRPLAGKFTISLPPLMNGTVRYPKHQIPFHLTHLVPRLKMKLMPSFRKILFQLESQS